jgi:hypothetical protein
MNNLLLLNNLKETVAWIVTAILIILSREYIIDFIKFVLSELYEIFITHNPLSG